MAFFLNEDSFIDDGKWYVMGISGIGRRRYKSGHRLHEGDLGMTDTIESLKEEVRVLRDQNDQLGEAMKILIEESIQMQTLVLDGEDWLLAYVDVTEMDPVVRSSRLEAIRDIMRVHFGEVNNGKVLVVQESDGNKMVRFGSVGDALAKKLLTPDGEKV